MPPFFMKTENARYDVKNFLDRLDLIYEWFAIWFATAVIANFYMQKSLVPVIPDFDYMTFNRMSSMSFTDMPTQLHLPDSRNNELFVYGAYCKQFRNLSGKSADFVNDPSSRGTILLAFGALVDWKEAPAERPMSLGSHIRLSDWVPQQELLNHPRTKLFITHGGLKSLKEATCAEMPTLFLPILGEQVRNSWLAYHHGFGQIINKFNVTADYLLYFEDAPIPPLQEGAFKIKGLIKYGGRMPEYFYTRSTNIDYVRYLNLDLILLIPSLICLLLLVK
ncbi:unnamed protein product [Gongylonema pulchrum]|uniref:glucuronosyltransferase n=1 Tax=Gongylonema pulchrum TaxID=637853 RepID=A0A183EIG5_9BILA|nr:unnamed protein product [Gongylonema pulchrum]